MLHIVNDCPDMKFPGGLSALHLTDEEAVAWFGNAEHTLKRRSIHQGQIKGCWSQDR